MAEVRAGVNHQVSLGALDAPEQNVVKSLSLVWHVTFARAESFKGSEYSIAFVKPTGELKKQFNLDREVLVVMIPYPTFDNRVFDFVDRKLDIYANRLDKLCVITVAYKQRFATNFASFAR